MTPAPGPDVELDDDAAIIERSWREPERFAVLFDRHAARIHRYVARRVGREVADDLVAETFLAAFAKRRGYFTAYRDAGPWLYGIATNLVGQHRREEVRQFRIRQAAWPELIAWEQLSYTETARALAIPVGTVRSRLNRARARLRATLAAGPTDTFEEILANE
jgi:DNA-directed RNA polymerase specialized sigma24 family protein